MNEFPRLYPDLELPDPESLKKPPLTQRVAQFWFEVTQEEFDEKLPRWLEEQMSSGAFQKKQVTDQWEFRVEIKDNSIPRPKATLTQIPKLSRTIELPLTLEIVPPKNDQAASLKILQPRSDNHSSRFADFQKECEKWLSSMMVLFDLSEIKHLSLTYRNEFSRERYPEYWESGNELRLGSILKLFADLPKTPGATFLGNFVMDFTRELSEAENRSLRFHICPDPKKKKHLVWLTDLTFSSEAQSLKKGLDAILLELHSGHSFIFEEFCVQFTSEALSLFSK